MTQVKTVFSKMLFIAVLAMLNACNPAKPTPDFSLAFSPATLNMNAGETKSSTLTITPIGGFDVNAPVTVAVEGTIFGAGDTKIQAAKIAADAQIIVKGLMVPPPLQVGDPTGEPGA